MRRIVWGTGNKNNVAVLREWDVVFMQKKIDLPQHRNVEGSCIIISIAFDAIIKIARPILSEFIFCFDTFNEIMLLSDIFHAKVVNN